MENQNGWKRPLMVAGISIGVIFLYTLIGVSGKLDAFTLGIVFLIQSLFSFFIAIGQLISKNYKHDGLKQMLIAGVLLLISFGVCSQGNLNIH
jgi:VIT1/CCC1 family predicted Fe2+/Mn2+ transporter